MIQRTVIYRARPAARVAIQSPENAFHLGFLALAFGLPAGVGLARVVIPVVIHTVLDVVERTVTGA